MWSVKKLIAVELEQFCAHFLFSKYTPLIHNNLYIQECNQFIIDSIEYSQF